MPVPPAGPSLPSEQDATLPGQPSTPPSGANSPIGNAPATTPTATDTATVGNWWDQLWAGIAGATGFQPFLGFLGGGGFSWADLASGLESAFVAFFKDIFDLIIGPLEILLGIVLWLIAIILIFKDDITALAPAAIGAIK